MRPSWDDYFIHIARQVATRATCLRRKVGAVLVKDKRILATGYNGACKGLIDCLDRGECLRNKLNIPSGTQHEICYANHAEVNAIYQAASSSTDISNSVLYCTHQPCILCTKALINCGIKEIHYVDGYPDNFSMELLKETNITLTHHHINRLVNIEPL